MSKKLTFEEFLAKRKPMQSIEAALENEIHYAINQFTKHKDEEINELKKKVEELEKSNLKFNAQNTGLRSKCSATEKENESLKKKLEEAVDIISSLCSATEDYPERRRTQRKGNAGSQVETSR